MSIDPTQASKMQRTWKPTFAGILNIIGGLICGIFAYAAANIYPLTTAFSDFSTFPNSAFSAFSPGVCVAILLVLALLAIAGGIVSIGRVIWGLAIAGAVAAHLGLQFVAGVLLCDSMWRFGIGMFTFFNFDDLSEIGRLAIFGISLAFVSWIWIGAAIVVGLSRKEFKEPHQAT